LSVSIGMIAHAPMRSHCHPLSFAAVALALFVALFYVVTIAKIGGNIASRAM